MKNVTPEVKTLGLQFLIEPDRPFVPGFVGFPFRLVVDLIRPPILDNVPLDDHIQQRRVLSSGPYPSLNATG